MLMERGGGESEPEDGEKSFLVEAIKAKLTDLREFGGKTGEAATPRLEKMLEGIENGDEGAYKEAVKEFGGGEVLMGEQKLSSKGMKIKKISPEEHQRIKENLDRFD